MRILAVLLLILGFVTGAKAAKDELVIGITQFPSAFHPNFDSMLAKTYILAMTRRPFTAYDKIWRLVCMLCTELPTIENGMAVPETVRVTWDRTLERKQVGVSIFVKAEAEWPRVLEKLTESGFSAGLGDLLKSL